MLDTLTALLEAGAAASWVLPAVAVLAAVDALLPPVPSEGVVVALAAVAVAGHGPHPLLLALAAALGAFAGDTLTFVIQYRNMGNTPIREVTVVDSLLPRLGYVKGSAQGPRGTAFTAEENSVGSTELRWVLPAPVPPGVEGHVSFQAVVR